MEKNTINKVIRMAWEDRTTFDEIKRKTGLDEAQVIKLMRQNLRPASFRRWRGRVTGRITKHEGKFRQSRKELIRLTSHQLFDQLEK